MSKSANVRPIMDLTSPEQKGMTNQLSASVAALYLASILKWDVLLPTIGSPMRCPDLDTTCYRYGSFLRVDFQTLYDVHHAKSFIMSRFSIRAYSRIPDGFKRVKQRRAPCTSSGCRDTYHRLSKLYSKFAGPVVVPGPGIAAGIIDSRADARGVELAVLAFKESQLVSRKFEKVFKKLMQFDEHFVALHYRFESDASVKHYTGSDAEFMVKFRTILTHKPYRAIRTIYVGGGLPLSRLLVSEPLQSFVKRFPAIHLVDKYALGEWATHNVTFVDAAVDQLVLERANLFFGTPTSSFSSLVALRRRIIHDAHSTMIPTPALPGSPCESIIHAHHGQWQFELTIPYNDCMDSDPCLRLQSVTKIRSLKVLKSCPFQGSTTGKYCTGMVATARQCKLRR